MSWRLDTRIIEPVPEDQRAAVADALRALLTVVTIYETIDQLQDGVIDVYRHERLWVRYRVLIEEREIKILGYQLVP